MNGLPLAGVDVVEVGDGFGVSVAGLLLSELGASVVKVTTDAGCGAGVGAILNRGKELRPPNPTADVLLVEEPLTSHVDAGVTVTFTDGRRASEDLLAPTETLLAEAASGILQLQLGHRDGPYCLASPIAGYGAGVLGALSAACGLVSRSRGAIEPWSSRVSYLDGALAFQALSASFVGDPTAEPTRDRYRDPYGVSYSPLLRFHRARDGWVFIGAISAHMWTTLFDLIGRRDLLTHPDLVGALPFNISVQAAGDEVARAIEAWVRDQAVAEIVDLLTSRGVVSAPVLSNADFLGHPQAAANGLLRTVGGQTQVGQFIKVVPRAGAAAPLPTVDNALPLSGLRVLDVSRHAAGPICGRVLADLGADVIRVETPQGEPNRAIGMTFAATNRGKLSLGLDIRHDVGREALRGLIALVDVVLTNALPDAARKLGVDPVSVAEVNPNASVLTILGFGRQPPFGGRRVVDAAAQALSGQALAEGGGREPVGCTGGFLDNGAGWLAALGGVAALYRRQMAGAASAVETSLLNTSSFIQMHRMASPPPISVSTLDQNRLGYTWYQRLYRTADGWIAVAANSTAQRAALATLAPVGEVHDLDVPELTAILAGWTTVEAGQRFGVAGFTQWVPVATLDDVARTRPDLFATLPQQPWGVVLQPRRLPVFADTGGRPLRGAPARPGQDNDEVLAMFGMSEAAKQRLLDTGVMLAEPPTVTMLATSV